MLALDQDIRLASLSDAQVLALAAEEKRIVLTYNVGDSVRIAREWAEAGRIMRASSSSRIPGSASV